MNGTDWLVISTGLAAVASVNWYFFLAERRSAVAVAGMTAGRAASSGASVDTGAEQAATIVVRGGYEPSTIRVRAGQPVRLTFDRQETASCSEEVVFPTFGVRTFLPAFQQTSIVVRPP